MTVPGRPLAAVREVDGVSVLAEPNRWTGLEDVERQVTPIWVRIDNDSDHDIRVRYTDVVLTTPDGHQYAALPPYLVGGEVQKPILGHAYAPVHTYHPHYRSFYLAPHYRDVYPGVPVWAHDFYADLMAAGPGGHTAPSRFPST